MVVITGCTSTNQTNRQIENLKTFTKLYGYVKYFHPSDEAATLDWDRFAVYGAKKVQNAESQKELISILNEPFLPIAPSMLLYDAGDEVKFDLNMITPEDTSGFKTIAWQHYGVGLSERSIYNSVRVNRKVAHKPNPNTWGSMVNQFDATPYRGLEFELEAYVKTHITSIKGGAQLWLRVDLENGETGFFENMGYKPIVNPEWARYTFSGKIDDDAQLINMGFFMRGIGEIWVDEYQLKVKEEDGWKQLKYENFENYEQDDLFEEWQIGIGKGSSGKSDIHSFTPANDEVYAGESSLKVTGSDHIDYSPPTKLFDAYPSFGEIITEQVGSNLEMMLPMALLGDESNTFPQVNAADLDQLNLLINQGIPDPLTGKNLNVRLADVVITWNIFKHFYPYFDVVDVDWEAALAEALEESFSDENESDFLMTLKKFTAKLKDGHIDVFLDGDTSTAFVLPLEWEWVEKSLVLTNILKEDLGLNLGDKVLEIDGNPSAAYFQEARQYLSAANESYMSNKLARYTTRGPKGTHVALKLMDANGEVYIKSIERSLSRNEHWDANIRNAKPSFKELDSDIYYLNLDKISMTEIDALLPRLEKASGIICDLRGYPNGNHDFISHLLEENDTSSQWMRIPQITYPNYEKLAGLDPHGWGLQAKSPHLDAKVVFMINGRAISYAESYMGLIDHYNLATIIGEPTAGTNGNVNPFILPGGYSIGWTGMKVLKHDGSQHHGVGIIPDIPVSKTIEGIRQGRDEYLEKAIEIIESK